MEYPKICPTCNHVNEYERIHNNKEICQSCRKELPKEKKRKVVGMMDSSGIVRVG